jgi:hypothetical protein
MICLLLILKLFGSLILLFFLRGLIGHLTKLDQYLEDNQYVWRGSMATGSPAANFQPTLAFTKVNFEIGVWGSTDFVGSYKEFDPFNHLAFGIRF